MIIRQLRAIMPPIETEVNVPTSDGPCVCVCVCVCVRQGSQYPPFHSNAACRQITLALVVNNLCRIIVKKCNL